MFGKPQWFRPKTFGWGLVPVTWQGWAYTAAWMLAIALPFLVLIGRHQALEAMCWLCLSSGALIYDIRQLLRVARGIHSSARRAATGGTPKGEDDILYILDGGQGPAVATRNYDLRVRR
jgi:hypothetical protein